MKGASRKHAAPRAFGSGSKSAHVAGRQGVAKQQRSALAASIAGARKSQQHSTETMLGLHLSTELNEKAATAEEILGLVRECVNEAGGQLRLCDLGSEVRRLSMSRCLNNSAGPLHKQIKSTWGSWEVFVRQQAADEFLIIDDTLRARAAPMVDDLVQDDHSQSRRSPAASEDVNSLALELKLDAA
jgi:hypothetical protein